MMNIAYDHSFPVTTENLLKLGSISMAKGTLSLGAMFYKLFRELISLRANEDSSEKTDSSLNNFSSSFNLSI
jgi:hypothetical protein